MISGCSIHTFKFSLTLASLIATPSSNVLVSKRMVREKSPLLDSFLDGVKQVNHSVLLVLNAVLFCSPISQLTMTCGIMSLQNVAECWTW
jgi:hypothetical protein